MGAALWIIDLAALGGAVTISLLLYWQAGLDPLDEEIDVQLLAEVNVGGVRADVKTGKTSCSEAMAMTVWWAGRTSTT